MPLRIIRAIATVLASLAALPTGAAAANPSSADSGSAIGRPETEVVTPSGVPIGKGWALAFRDDFSGTSLNASYWFNYKKGRNDNGGTWDPACVIVNNGLTMQQYYDAADGTWHGGGIETRGPNTAEHIGPYGGVYMTIEFAATVKQANGLGPYFLFWDSTQWPPEWDIAEFPNTENPGARHGGPNRAISTYHFGAGNRQPDPITYPLANQNAQPHVYTAQFGPDGFALWIDGVAQPIPLAWNRHVSANPSDRMAGAQAWTFGIGTAAPGLHTRFAGGGRMGPNPLLTTVRYVAMWLKTK